MRLETIKILETSFSSSDKILFEEFSKIIENGYKNLEMHRKIWKYDQEIGGLGGYAAPLNPIFNPFNHLRDF